MGYARWWWHSKPVARALLALDRLGVLVSEHGRTDGTPGFEPFYVVLRRTELTPGPEEPAIIWTQNGPEELPPGPFLYVTSPLELGGIAQEAKRRVRRRPA